MRISELIANIGPSGNRRTVAQVHAMFADSIFGLLMEGVPKGEHGRKILVDGSGSVTMHPVRDPGGKLMIKACADPELFAANYPGSFNVTMSGRELLEMAEKMPQTDGILICSATAFVSFPVYKADYHKLRRAKSIDRPRKWWQFWKPAE